MKTLAAVYWMIDGVSWLCHVVADLTCSSFILLTSCILALPTYRLLGWSSWRWCMVFQQNHDSTLTDALCGRWLTMVFGHCLGSCRTNALSVAEKTRVFFIGSNLGIAGVAKVQFTRQMSTDEIFRCLAGRIMPVNNVEMMCNPAMG